MTDINNKVIWITGTSSGIGEALVYQLANQGATCAITARRSDILQQVANSRDNIKVYQGDVNDLSVMKEIVQQIENDLGPIDILIANAGTHVFSKPEEFNSEEYLSLMNINYGGTLHTIEAILPSMIKRGSGHLVCVASLAGYRGLPRAAAYGASKAALINFVESIRFHLELKNIKVTLVNPGYVKTPLTDKNDFHMPFLIGADQAAKIMIKGIVKNKKQINFPTIFAWIINFLRIIPYSLYEVIIYPIWKQHKKNLK